VAKASTFVVHAIDLARTFEVGETQIEALRGINLEVEPGQFVALVGPSGSGKSTFLNLVGGLDRPTEGELWVDGVELSASKEKVLTEHRRRRVGFVFQSFNLLPRLTAQENVALPLMFVGVPERERLQRARGLLTRVGLQERLEHRPTQLSGGEQQRVAIARALVGQPAIILADEPTGNIDSTTGAEIMALLRRLNREQGVTLLLVTHDLEAAAYADLVVQLRDGQIVGGRASHELP
jgi:putative ABC transport system ATP-binding protein